MAKVNLPDRSIYEPAPAEQPHAVTTPQGTQHRGVAAGHENRDINVRGVMNWFVILGVIIALTYILLYGMFQVLNYFVTRRDVAASPVLAERIAPPEPRLLPNPLQAKENPSNPFIGPGEWMVMERAKEYEEMNKIGLRNPATGEFLLPDNIVNTVGAQGTPAVAPPIGGGQTDSAPLDGMFMPLPSDPSGGRMMENGLR